MRMVSTVGRVLLPMPQRTQSCQRPASEPTDPLAKSLCQYCMVLPCNLWPRAAIEGDMRHTSTGATLPYWSVLLQMISVLVQEHMTTHTPASSPSLSQKRDQLSHRGSCPSLGAASTPAGTKNSSAHPACVYCDRGPRCRDNLHRISQWFVSLTIANE